MPKPNPYRPFNTDPEQNELKPKVSGNTINGLGESEFRPAQMVYWAPVPDDIPHGQLQNFFYRQSARDPRFAIARAKRQEVLDAPLSPVAKEQAVRAPDDWTSGLDRFVTEGLCEKVGVAGMNADWVFEGHEIPQSRVIVIGVQHNYDQISAAPEATAGLEVMAQYGRAANVAKEIAGWIREQGWEAEPVTGPMTGSLALIPPAIACGFGELGKHGSIINPEMGASFRLSAVLTDAPFTETSKRSYGVDEFCQNCRICEDACPPEALFSSKQTVRGVQKWYVDFDKCLPFFNQNFGCAICIAVCPWSRPGVGLNLAEKLARRAERLSNT